MSSTATESKTASREQLNALWQALLDTFMKYLDETPVEKRRASFLAEIRAFLHDNGVTVDLTTATDVKRNVVALRDTTLPFK